MSTDFTREASARSLYAQTARPAPPTRPLEGDSRCEVVIVGAGYTGLSAALHLAEAGRDALVLEARDIGFGASGRNGGQINPGLKWEPERLIAAFGAELGERMARLGDEAPGLVFELVARHAIDCEAHRGGTIRAASRARAEAGILEHVRQGTARGADIAWLDGAAMARLTGASAYLCGSLDRRGGNLNPLGYARGLAEAALKRGARIFTETRAIRLARRTGGWCVETERGAVSARLVLIASNGYTDALAPELRRSLVPVLSSIVATEPLPREIAASILPGRASVYEMSALHAYYRLDGAGRFLMGGRGVLRPSPTLADCAHLIAHGKALFPWLSKARWTHAWNGRVAVTSDELPHIHEPEPGLSIALGYNGRGVAMATSVGRMMARRAMSGATEELDLPVTAVRPMPGHFAWPLAVTARLGWERMKERLGL